MKASTKRIILRIVHLVAVIPVLGLAVTVSAQADHTAKIDALIKRTMAGNHIPGLSVAVVKEGKVILAKGYGLSNLELSTPATEKTAYAIFSITKTFTAIGVMMLAEEGKVSLDRPITDYVSGLPGSWKQATVRHLLTHTSGLPELCDSPAKPCDRSDDYAQGQLIGFVADAPFVFQPGDRWEYNNTGFYVLGMLIEQVSGTPYGKFLEDRIFKPLKMDQSRLDDYSAVIPNRASGYTWKNGHFINALRVSPTLTFSLAGIVSTVLDLAKYDAALYDDRLLKQSVLREMWTKAKLNNGSEADQGLGFGMTPYKGHRRVGHSGGHAGFATTITRLIDDKVTVIILSNADDEGYAKGSSGFLMSDVANEIASFYFK